MVGILGNLRARKDVSELVARVAHHILSLHQYPVADGHGQRDLKVASGQSGLDATLNQNVSWEFGLRLSHFVGQLLKHLTHKVKCLDVSRLGIERRVEVSREESPSAFQIEKTRASALREANT